MRKTLLTIFLYSSFICAQEGTTYQSDRNDEIFIITANGSIFDQARNELVNELRDEFSISISEINDSATVNTIEEINRLFNNNAPPKAVVLIGNNAIRLYQKYAALHKKKTETIQVITLLALDVPRAVSGLPNVNAVAYETPMITALVNFRRVINKPVSKVGVLYRKPHRDFVTKHTRYCLKENIDIRGIEISENISKHQTEIADGLKMLLKNESVDALWIANDNVLLKPDLLGNVWLPALKKIKVPLIVGVEALANPKLNFGTFAVIPDPVALGEQTAEIIFDLKSSDWEHRGIISIRHLHLFRS
jgi:hypothetical protein